MDEDFDPASHGLIRLPLEEIGGLLFVSFNQEPTVLGAATAALAGMTDLYGWSNAKVAARRTYAVAANWKLALENYHECYHCGPAHPEFAVLHALARPGARIAGYEAWDAIADGGEPFRVMPSELAKGALTGSRDGRLMAPPMGPTDGTFVFAEVGYLYAFLAYADHGVLYRFMPRSVLETEMEVIWLVAGEAEEGRDYDPGALTWLWDVTSLADKRIIETNQAGVLSRFYRPGPFSEMEPGTRQFVDRYLADLAALG
jgi:Rieske 2Fe-2S family protein